MSEVDPGMVTTFTGGLHDRYGFATDVAHLTSFGTCATCDGQ